MELKIALPELIQNERIELRKSGKCYKARCPFHEDKTPSFYVYPDSNRFICYGCGEKGDAIDFIRKLKNLTFKEAKVYLGIKNKTSKPKDAAMTRRKKLLTDFRQWEVNYYEELTTEYRCINRALRNIRTMEKAEQIACLYHRLAVLEYQMDILAYGCAGGKTKLKMEVQI